MLVKVKDLSDLMSWKTAIVTHLDSSDPLKNQFENKDVLLILLSQISKLTTI